MLATQQWQEFADAIEHDSEEDGYDVYRSGCTCPNGAIVTTVSQIVADHRGRTRIVDLASAEVPANDVLIFQNEVDQQSVEPTYTSSR